jgi:hypothetical protein
MMRHLLALSDISIDARDDALQHVIERLQHLERYGVPVQYLALITMKVHDETPLNLLVRYETVEGGIDPVYDSAIAKFVIVDSAYAIVARIAGKVVYLRADSSLRGGVVDKASGVNLAKLCTSVMVPIPLWLPPLFKVYINGTCNRARAARSFEFAPFVQHT